jgi:ABC-type sugar transport system ATPase subunit
MGARGVRPCAVSRAYNGWMQIALSHLTRAFDSGAGLFDASVEIRSGELLTVVGPSGAGKSTLLRLVAGLEQSDHGSLHFDQRDVTLLPPDQRDIGLLAQRPALYSHLSIERNLSIGLEMWQSRHRDKRVDPAALRRRVSEAIRMLELGELLGRRPEQLSGGEQQRLALGRVLVRRPPVWLLDEPLSHLDATRKIEFRRHLHLLRRSFPATIILVTHDPVEALTLGQRLAVLNNGRLAQVGTPPDLYARPADRFVAGFLGWPPLNLADGVLIRNPANGGLRFAAVNGSFHLPVPAELVTHGAEGQPVAVGIRPESLTPTPPAAPPAPQGPTTLPGWRVVRAEFVPPRWLVTVANGPVEWRLWHESPPPSAGDAMDLSCSDRDLHWFGGRDGRRIDGEG